MAVKHVDVCAELLCPHQAQIHPLVCVWRVLVFNEKPQIDPKRHLGGNEQLDLTECGHNVDFFDFFSLFHQISEVCDLCAHHASPILSFRWWVQPTVSWIRMTPLQDTPMHQSQPTQRLKSLTIPSKNSRITIFFYFSLQCRFSFFFQLRFKLRKRDVPVGGAVTHSHPASLLHTHSRLLLWNFLLQEVLTLHSLYVDKPVTVLCDCIIS